MDLNELVGTDQAFLLGSWESMARKFAEDGSDDCTPPDHPEVAVSQRVCYVVLCTNLCPCWSSAVNLL